ncbi:MAG TPA: hypothetical protein VFJ82_16570 [Longimicrobium sp.]|nr:hypothetical protein [Longimicrobium sp.]
MSDENEPGVIEDGPLRYLLSVPADGGDGPWPVLCFLHGYDEAAPMEIRAALMRHGPLRAGNPAIVRGFIVVAPQLPQAGDHWFRHADDVWHVIERVRGEHGGDARRTFLTGFSYGGNGVWDVGLLLAGRWAALWAVDPTRVPVEDPGAPVWLSFGNLARRQKGAFIDALRLHPAGGAAPHGARIWEDEGEDHVGSARRAYADERIYRWLLSRQLPDAPAG